MCKSWCELTTGVVIALLALWQAIAGQLVPWANWVIVVGALLLVYHSFTCKRCFGSMNMPKEAPKKRR